MEWFFASMALLMAMLGTGFAAGALIIVWLPRRLQPAARLFLAAPLGWALLALPATLLGWVGHGYTGWHCTIISGLLVVAGAAAGRRNLPQWGREFAPLGAFALLASFPILCPLLLRGSFSEYNDTFIYLTHGQWLQRHGFAHLAQTDGGHPAWGQTLGFQDASLRMGASFLFGWVQAAFHLPWSYEIYPAFAALGLICGALAIGATVLAACPGAQLEAWLAALAVAATVNGFAFGAAEGFLGQTWGLAFAALAFALRGWEMATGAARKSRFGCWRTGVPMGIAVAAAMHCYWELVPFTGTGLAASYLVPWPGRNAQLWRRAWSAAWPALLVSVALVNAEWVRAVHGILMNLSLVVANPVAWNAWDFPAHGLGLKASVWSGGRWITQGPPVAMRVGGTFLIALVAVLSGPRLLNYVRTDWRWLVSSQRAPAWRGRVLVPAVVWLGLSTALFVFFRYFVKSPWQTHPNADWPDGIGQSWSQYKVTTWGSALLIGVASATAVGASRKFLPRLGQPLLLVVLALWCGTGLGWNVRLADYRSKRLCLDAECAQDPFTVCLGIREMLAKVPAKDWIYLDFPAGTAKYRQLLTYFLSDHPLAADWQDDGYLWPYVTPADARRNASNCDWILSYHPLVGDQGTNAGIGTLGGLTLARNKTRLPLEAPP